MLEAGSLATLPAEANARLFRAVHIRLAGLPHADCRVSRRNRRRAFTCMERVARRCITGKACLLLGKDVSTFARLGETAGGGPKIHTRNGSSNDGTADHGFL